MIAAQGAFWDVIFFCLGGKWGEKKKRDSRHKCINVRRTPCCNRRPDTKWQRNSNYLPHFPSPLLPLSLRVLPALINVNSLKKTQTNAQPDSVCVCVCVCIYVSVCGCIFTHTRTQTGARQCVWSAASVSPSSVIIAINSLLAASLSILSSPPLHPSIALSLLPYIKHTPSLPPRLHPSGSPSLHHQTLPPSIPPFPVFLLFLPGFFCVMSDVSGSAGWPPSYFSPSQFPVLSFPLLSCPSLSCSFLSFPLLSWPFLSSPPNYFPALPELKTC